MAKDYPAWGDDFDRDDFLRDLDAAAIRYLSENSDDILGRLDSLPINQLLSLPFHVPYGPLQIAIWEECVKRQELMAPADTAGPAAARLNLVDALAMGGQLHRVPAVFELVEDYYYDSWGVEQHPEFLEHFAWHYRNYIQALTDDPTTPADDLHAALGRMKELYILLNDDMKSYYLRAYQVHKELGEEQEAAELRELWINTPPSKLSDCTGCDPVYVVKMHAAIGDWGQAVAVGEKALENPDLLCDAQPENLYLSLLTPWLRTGADCVAIEAHFGDLIAGQGAAQRADHRDRGSDCCFEVKVHARRVGSFGQFGRVGCNQGFIRRDDGFTAAQRRKHQLAWVVDTADDLDNKVDVVAGDEAAGVVGKQTFGVGKAAFMLFDVGNCYTAHL